MDINFKDKTLYTSTSVDRNNVVCVPRIAFRWIIHKLINAADVKQWHCSELASTFGSAIKLQSHEIS